MISVTLMGGLCNLMFQIAFIESLGKKYNKEVCYHNAKEHILKLSTYTRSPHASDYINIFKHIDFYKNINRFSLKRNINVPFHYVPITPEDGDNFIGYFQNGKYFYNIDFIRWLFTPSSHVQARIDKYNFDYDNTCSLHVRRGDYLSMQGHHPVQTIDYYTKALKCLKTPVNVLIFSDDIQWCKNIFTENNITFMKDIDYVELFVMSKCKHHILANSSFSLMSALLGEREDSIIVAPTKWFGEKFPHDYAKDVVPEKWIKI